jgi:hypothetical protein
MPLSQADSQDKDFSPLTKETFVAAAERSSSFGRKGC